MQLGSVLPGLKWTGCGPRGACRGPGRSGLGSRGGPARRSTWKPPGSPRGSDKDTRVPARPLAGLTVALLRESAPWSRGELGVPLRVTWWVPSESGAARGGRGRAELAGHVARECQSMSESRRYTAIQVSVPRAWECHTGSRGRRPPARCPGLGSPLGSGWWSLEVTAAMLHGWCWCSRRRSTRVTGGLPQCSASPPLDDRRHLRC